jgi:hypothetical protein
MRLKSCRFLADMWDVQDGRVNYLAGIGFRHRENRQEGQQQGDKFLEGCIIGKCLSEMHRKMLWK